MLSEWDWKGVKLHYSLYYNITPFPVKWNEASRHFSFDFRNPRKYWTWYLTFFGGLGIWAIPTLAYACLLKNNQVPLFLSFCYGLMICLILFIIGTALVILAFGHETVSCLNSIVKIQKELVRMQPHELDAVERNELSKAKQTQLASLIHMGKKRVLYALVCLIALTPFVVTAAAEMINANPLQFLVSDVLEIFSIKYSSVSWITYISIRIACALVLLLWTIEGFRLVPYAVIFLMIPCVIWLSNVFLMNLFFVNNLKKTENLRRVIRIHLKLNLVQTVVSEFVSLETFILEKFAGYLIALFMFLVIRMYRIIPLELYGIFVIATPVLITLSFPTYYIVAKVYTGSLSNIHAWQKLITPERKELVRMLAVLRPLGFHKGLGGSNFGPLNLDAFKQMVLRTQEQTVDFLILLPANLFE